MGNGHSIDDVFDVKGSLYECGGDDLSLDVLSARTIQDNKPVTIFHHTASPKYQDVLSTCYKYSRVLRHPKLLKVLSCDLSAGGSGLTVVTEPARPLSALLADDKAALSVLHPAELAWQLHGILDAVAFLHSGHVSHNNIGEQSVFVAIDGTWKLGRLDCAYPLPSSAAAAGADSGWTASGGLEYLGRASALVSAGRLRGDGGPPGVGNDAYGLSKLVDRLRDRLADIGDDAVEDFGERLVSLFEESSGMTPSSASSLSTSLSSLLDHPIFRTEFQQVASFLATLCTKSENSKTAFFRSLVPRLKALPPDLVARCLVKRLLTRFVVLNGTARCLVLPALFTPRWTPDELEQVEKLTTIDRRGHCACHVCAVGGVLPVSEFGTSVLVLALKLLRLHDVEAKSIVLEHFHAFCALFSMDCLRTVVMPLVVRCLRGSSQVLTSLALHALADLVPLLGIEAVFSAQYLDGSGGSIPLFSGRLQQQLQQPALAAAAAAAGEKERPSYLRGSAATSSVAPAAQSDEESLSQPAIAGGATESHFGLPRSAVDRSSQDRSNSKPLDRAAERHMRSTRGELRHSGDGGGLVSATAERAASPPPDKTAFRDSAFTGGVNSNMDARRNRGSVGDAADAGNGSRNVKNALRLGVRVNKQEGAHSASSTGSAVAANAKSGVVSDYVAADGEVASKLAASIAKQKGFDADGLDIKMLTIKNSLEEVDYFADMAPRLSLPTPGNKPPPLPRFGEHGVVDAGVRSSGLVAKTAPKPSSLAEAVPTGIAAASSPARSKFESARLMPQNANEVSDWDDGGWADTGW